MMMVVVVMRVLVVMLLLLLLLLLSVLVIAASGRLRLAAATASAACGRPGFAFLGLVGLRCGGGASLPLLGWMLLLLLLLLIRGSSTRIAVSGGRLRLVLPTAISVPISIPPFLTRRRVSGFTAAFSQRNDCCFLAFHRWIEKSTYSSNDKPPSDSSISNYLTTPTVQQQQ
jgi:hypothetical protein